MPGVSQLRAIPFTLALQPLYRTQKQAALTEVNTSTQDANYTRQQVNAAGWTLASSSTDQQTVTNAANIEYSASSGVATYTVTHAFVADASTGGNILFVGALDASKAIASGDIFRINAGNLTIELK